MAKGKRYSYLTVPERTLLNNAMEDDITIDFYKPSLCMDPKLQQQNKIPQFLSFLGVTQSC